MTVRWPWQTPIATHFLRLAGESDEQDEATEVLEFMHTRAEQEATEARLLSKNLETEDGELTSALDRAETELVRGQALRAVAEAAARRTATRTAERRVELTTQMAAFHRARTVAAMGIKGSEGEVVMHPLLAKLAEQVCLCVCVCLCVRVCVCLAMITSLLLCATASPTRLTCLHTHPWLAWYCAHHAGRRAPCKYRSARQDARTRGRRTGCGWALGSSRAAVG